MTEHYFRGDSACYDKPLMNWLRNQQREDFPLGPIRFAISARMQSSLKEHILRARYGLEPYREDREAVSEYSSATTKFISAHSASIGW